LATRTRNRLAAALLALAPAAGAVVPEHLGITVIQPAAGTTPTRSWTIYLDGYIDPGAADRLAAVVGSQRIGRATVYLNSPGGSLIAGMSVGRLLRAHRFDTSVGRRAADPLRPGHGVCYSACPFAYAGGVRRSLLDGSVLGVHLAANRVPVPDQQAFDLRVAEDATHYLREMGVSPGLVTVMDQAPHGAIRLLSYDEAEQLRLVSPEGT